MKRVVPFLAGVVVGGVLVCLVTLRHGQPEAPVPPRNVTKPPPLESLRQENADLRAALAEAQNAHVGTDEAGEADIPVRLGTETDDPTTGVLRVCALGADGEPRPGESVVLCRDRNGYLQRESAAETADDGTAVFSRLPSGMRLVGVYRGSSYRSVGAPVLAGRITEVTLTLSSGEGIVEGRVLHRLSGPLRAQLYLQSVGARTRQSFSAQADESGHYRIEGVPPGRYRLTVTCGAISYSRDLHEDIEVAEGQCVLKDFRFGVPAITGTIRDARTRLPVPEAQVVAAVVCVHGVRYGGRIATTDEDGAYRICDLRGGTYQVAVSREGYGSLVIRPVEVPPEGRQLDLVLERAAILKLRVTDPSGYAFNGVLTVTPVPVREGEGSTAPVLVPIDMRGEGVCRRILPGEYTLRFSCGRLRSEPVKTVLALGGNALRVQLR
jgi:hypothetical protein